MTLKEQLTNISIILNNASNTTQLLTSFNALDVAQQKVLLTSKLLTAEQKSQFASMLALSSVNSKYTAEQLIEVTGVSAKTLANWGLVDSTKSLTIAELAELAVSDKQAKNVLDKIIAQNAQTVVNSEVTASNIALTASESSATLATGALTTSIKSNISAMWTWLTTTPLGWLTLLAAGIFVAVKAYDALTVSVEEQREKLESSLSAYEEAKSELSSITTELELQEQAVDDLLSKENLTYTEKGQLEELQAITKELRIQKDLAEKGEDRTKKEIAKDAADLFNKQFGDYEISEQSISKYQANADLTGNNAILTSDENNISSMIAGYKQINELLDEAYSSGSQDDIDHFKSLTEDLKYSIFATAQELQSQQENISAYYESIKDTPYKELTTEQKEIIGTYNEISNALALIYRHLDPNTWNTMQLDNIFDTYGIEKTKEELVSMAQSGKLTPEIIKEFTNLNNALNESTLPAEDFCNLLYAIAEAQNTTFDDKTSNSRISMISSINDLSKGFEELDKIYSSIKDDEPFDFKLLDNDNFKETFSDLDSYTDFIEQITNNSDDLETCQSAFNNLVSEWITDTGVLENVTEENAKLTKAMLKQMGVANAEEVVTNALANAKTRLAAEEEYLTASKELDEIKSSDLTSATYEEISALLSEGYASETTRQYLAQLALSKFNVNAININTQSDIDNIIALANAAGASTEYVNALETALNNLQNGGNTKSIAKNYLTTEGQFYIKSNKEAWAQEVATDAEFNAKRALQNVLSSINENKLNASDFYTNIDYTGGSTSNIIDSSATKTKETFNWIETALSRIQRTITNLGKSVSATWKSWSTRNSDLAKQISTVNQEISLQTQAYNAYMAKANAVGLPAEYQELVKNGTIRIDEISDESLKQKIQEFQEWYEKALACEDTIQDLNDELATLARQKFDNISKQYEDKLSGIEHEISMLESYIDLTETSGHLVSANYYSALINAEQENIDMLKQEHAALTASLNEAVASGKIKEGSEEWYSMMSDINSVEQAIVDADTALIGYQNNLRELEWENFDKMQDKISQITDESNFLIDLMDDEKMFDDNGNMTASGQATMGLYTINLSTAKAQIAKYEEELAKVQELLAADPFNQNLVEHADELRETIRDLSSDAKDAEQSLKDFASEGCDAFLNSMEKIIDKRKEALQSAKDLYDYEKNIAEQTKEIATLEKQLAAYQGDNSEESRSTIQQIKVSLDKAKEDLKETEYEQYISDQEQMLDSLYSETEQWMNERLDNIDLLIQNAIDSAGSNSGAIMETLRETANQMGITLSEEMESIWSSDGTIGSVMTSIEQYFADMEKDSEERAQKQLEDTAPPDDAPTTNKPTAYKTFTTSNTTSGWGSWFIAKKDSYPKSRLNSESSIVDRLKLRDFDSSFSARASYYSAMGGSGTYRGNASQNAWMLAQMRAHGYKRGGIIGDMIQAAGEEGIALVRRGEGIIPTHLMPEWEQLIQNLQPLNQAMDAYQRSLIALSASTSTPHTCSQNLTINGVTLEFPDVKDVNEFITDLQYSKRFENIIQEIAFGKNSLSKYKY